MKEWMIANLPNMLFALVFVGIVVLLWVGFKGRYRAKAKQMLLSLVTAAEKEFGGGTGELKFAYVSQRLFEIMPGIFQVFFTVEDISGWIEEAVAKMKEYLALNQDAALGCIASAKLTQYRLAQLEKKVEKHNSVIERTFTLEGQMREVEHDIRDLKGR